MIDFESCNNVSPAGRQCVGKRDHAGPHRCESGRQWAGNQTLGRCPTCESVGAVGEECAGNIRTYGHPPITYQPPRMPTNMKPPPKVYPPDAQRAIDIVTDVNAFFRQRNSELRDAFLKLRSASVSVMASDASDAWNELGKALEETASLASDLTGRFRP